MKRFDQPTQQELLPPDHMSMHTDRLRNFGHVNPEAFYAAAWRAVNGRRNGRGYLHYILCSEQRRWIGFTTAPYSRRDAIVAASVIQWLGTNVGRGFVLECERKIDEAQKKHWSIGAKRANARGGTDTRTPLQRRKATLDAARKRMADVVNKESK